jgi:DNA-binding MarR family transcriptional regulator
MTPEERERATPEATAAPGPELLGTRLRHLLDRLDAGVAAVHADLGPAGFRPRYTPVIREIAAAPGRCASISDLALATGVTHSAASQTVALMTRDGLLVLAPDEGDARRRVVRLTPKAREMLPALDTGWKATLAAARELEAELPYPLSRLVDETLAALDRRPMRRRIAEVVPEPVGPAPGPDEGGEPPCMLDQVCPACGRIGENPVPGRCGNCGEEFPDV